MAYKQNNVTYYGLDFDPKTPEEALEALKKVKYCIEAYKPDVASAALKYFSVITNSMPYCDWYEHLIGEVRSNMSVLAGATTKSFVDSQGYVNKFSSALGIMILRCEQYLDHKEKFHKNIPLLKILGVE